MAETGTVERVVRISRPAVILNLLLLAASQYLLVLWLYPRYGDLIWVSLAIVWPFLAWAMWPLLRAFIVGTAILITDRGLLNYTGGITFVAWEEIETASISSWLGMKCVNLVTRNPERVLQRVPPMRRWFLERYLNRYGGKLTIYAYLAQGGAEPLFDTIRMKANVANVSGRGHR